MSGEDDLRETTEYDPSAATAADVTDVGIDLLAYVPAADCTDDITVAPDADHDDPQAALERQAFELAEHLKRRQGEVDHRQNQLNSQWADYESQVRSARLWFEARKQELDDRSLEASLAQDEREKHIEARQQTLEVRGMGLDAREQRLAQRASELDVREQEITAAQQRFDAERLAEECTWREMRERLSRDSADLTGRSEEQSRRMQKLQRELQLQSQWIEQRATELDEREARLTVEEQSLAERQQQWAEADLLLADSRRELTRLEQELGRERDSRAVELAARERQLDEEHRRREAVLARREQAVERQAEQLDHRRAALNESQQEVTALHREALEVRLATEELWAQLTRAVPAAMLSSTLADTRARLADHYRLASAELEARKAELQSLRTDLAEQHERLRRQTAEVEAWTAERLEELRRRELAMASRQSELDELRSQQHREYAGWREQRDRWEHQRRHFMIDQQAPGPRAPHLAGLAEARETADANI